MDYVELCGLSEMSGTLFLFLERKAGAEFSKFDFSMLSAPQTNFHVSHLYWNGSTDLTDRYRENWEHKTKTDSMA